MKTTTLLVALGLVAVVAPSVVSPPPTAQPGCLHEGTWHPEGSSFLNPDKPACNSSCVCRDGQVHCPIVDCFTPRCVDPEYGSDVCCHVCPNGPNCGFRGEIIPAGQRKQIGPYLCVCPAADSPDFSRRNNPVNCFLVRREPPVPSN